MFTVKFGFPEHMFFSTEPWSFNQHNADFQPHFDAGTPMSLWGLVTLGMVDPARTFHTVENQPWGSAARRDRPN